MAQTPNSPFPYPPRRVYHGANIPLRVIRRYARAIADEFHPDKIILFGSYASGTPTPDSDLDFLVVMESDQPRYRRSVPICMMFTPVPCAMDILVYTPDEVKKWNGATNHIVTEAYANGRILYDHRP